MPEDDRPARPSPPMKIYLAANDKSGAKETGEALHEAGHDVKAIWFEGATLTRRSKNTIQTAFDIVRAVSACEVLVIVSRAPATPASRPFKFVELGIALGLNKRVFVIGGRETNMEFHPLVRMVDDVNDVVNSLYC